MNADRLEALLAELRRALHRTGVTDEDALDEAREHLIDLVEDGIGRGLSTEAAEREALARFGEPDTVAAHFAEGRSPMFARLLSVAAWTCRTATLPPRRAVLVSLLLASPAMLFLLAVVLDEGFGIGTLMAPVETVMATPGWREAFNIVTPAIFLGGLVLGVLLNALAIGRLDLGWREKRLVSTLAIEPRAGNVAFIGAAALMLMIFVGYAFVENFQPVPQSGELARRTTATEQQIGFLREMLDRCNFDRARTLRELASTSTQGLPTLGVSGRTLELSDVINTVEGQFRTSALDSALVRVEGEGVVVLYGSEDGVPR